MAQPRSGLADVLVATAVAGIASYLITWFVPRVIGFAEYATFAKYWAALYLVVGTLAGMQQEVTRATVAVAPGEQGGANRARAFALAVAGVVLVVVAASSPLWASTAFPGRPELVVPLAVGAASYALVAGLGGTLQGLSRWRASAMLIIGDALLRLLAIGGVLLVTGDIVALAWAAAVPFGLAIVLLWPVVRGQVVGRAQLDVGYRALTWNVARTLTAAAATAAMVSGFPLLFGIAAAGDPAVIVAMIVLAATLVRAPLVIVAMALQNWLLVRFRDDRERSTRTLGIVLGGIVVLGAAFSALAWWLGPGIFAWLYPGEPTPSPLLVAGLVASSALVAALVVTGSALLARARHHAFTTGWVAGAIATIGALAVAVPPEERALVALLAGPLAGLTVHLVALAVRRGSPTGSDEQTGPAGRPQS